MTMEYETSKAKVRRRRRRRAPSPTVAALVVTTPTFALSVRLRGGSWDQSKEVESHEKLIEVARSLARNAAIMDLADGCVIGEDDGAGEP